MIPVKERACDPLSWHIVPLKGAQVSPTELDDAGSRDIRVTLNVAPRSKLGLGICKGPEWKPGIFVQFTKEIGVARDAGLRPGDQLLSCNGIDFSDILFSEAVAIMKSSSRLDLVVRTAVGLDLFPGESSGYNSSASSVTGGDQSPCWGDQASKRLSMVREENGHIDNTLGSTRRPKSWERGSEADRRMEKLHPVAPPRIPEDHDKNTKGSNTTIIKLSDTGTVINNTVIPHLSAVEVSTRQTTRVHVSPEAGDDTGYENDEDSMDRSKVADICFVSRQSETKTVIVEVHRNPGGAPESPSGAIPPPPPPGHTRTPSVVSTSSGCPSSLSSAISDELKRRAVRMQSNPGESIEAKCEKVQSQARKIGNSIGGHDNDRHNALMSEFKRAHRKMFKNSEENGLREDLPFADGAKNFSECRPPASPSPDYEDSSPAENHVATNGGSVRGTLSRVAASEMAKANGDMAEMESIESFKLTNPSSPPPRPPSHYFAPQSSGPPTMRKNRPVSVTIGEYGQVGRKEPAKFNFIARPDESPRNGNDEDMSQRLRNELEMTLSRSNLKKRSDIEMANGETTNGANGMATTVTINGDSKKENNCLENGKLILQKSISSNIEKTNGTANRVMITIPSKPELRKTESSPPSGILKNGGTTMAFTNGAPEHKNITFGNM
uniref:PDZ domain-containing protein n=2 Tax=Lutzomyia longipalpis TaxID=7200 RepID=A0A1B0CAE9_LUTLO